MHFFVENSDQVSEGCAHGPRPPPTAHGARPAAHGPPPTAHRHRPRPTAHRVHVQAFKKAEGESDVAVAVRWMAAEAERCGCSDFVLFGGTSWWVQLVDALGIELTEQERDVLLPTKLTNVTPPGSDKPIELPLVPPPCSARFVQIVLPEFAAGVKAGTGKNRGRWEASKASGRDVTGSGNTSGRAGSDEASTQASKATAAWTTPGKLRLPSEIEAMALGDAFAANALKFNPAPWDPGSSGLSKEAYYRRMADENVYSTY